MKTQSDNVHLASDTSKADAGHTPGPWHIEDASNVYASWREWRVLVAQTQSINKDFGSQRANAKLIAAAPGLLAACERVLRAIEWAQPADRMDPTVQAALLHGVITAAKGAA